MHPTPPCEHSCNFGVALGDARSSFPIPTTLHDQHPSVPATLPGSPASPPAFTRFVYPGPVSIELPLDLLLAPQLHEGSAVLHSLALFGKLPGEGQMGVVRAELGGSGMRRGLGHRGAGKGGRDQGRTQVKGCWFMVGRCTAIPSQSMARGWVERLLCRRKGVDAREQTCCSVAQACVPRLGATAVQGGCSQCHLTPEPAQVLFIPSGNKNQALWGGNKGMEEGRSCPLPLSRPLNPFSFQPLLGVFSQDLRHPCCPSLDSSASRKLSRYDDQSRERQQLGTALRWAGGQAALHRLCAGKGMSNAEQHWQELMPCPLLTQPLTHLVHRCSSIHVLTCTPKHTHKHTLQYIRRMISPIAQPRGVQGHPYAARAIYTFSHTVKTQDHAGKHSLPSGLRTTVAICRRALQVFHPPCMKKHPKP